MSKRAVIVGGSVGGLFAAHCLAAIGWDVEVYERVAGDLAVRGAGLGTHRDLFDVMRRIGVAVDERTGIEVSSRVCLARSGAILKEIPFEERKSPELSGVAIAMQLNQKYAGIKDAFIAMFPPPAVAGLGTVGGFKLQIEDRAGLGYEALNAAAKAFMAKAAQAPEITGLFSGFNINAPQLFADVDRVKARQLGVAVTDVFDTM